MKQLKQKSGGVNYGNQAKHFEIKKTFGTDVLIKLTKATIKGIKSSENGGEYTFNINVDESIRAANTTVENYNINLVIN